jgi:flagellar biosynthesis/type III secretory pathway M-ring protein FliF/YscJ
MWLKIAIKYIFTTTPMLKFWIYLFLFITILFIVKDTMKIKIEGMEGANTAAVAATGGIQQNAKDKVFFATS